MNKFIVKELNTQLVKDCDRIANYLKKCNLAKETIPTYEFIVNGVIRKVSFQILTYFSFINKNMSITNPFGYYEFEQNKCKTHYNYVKHNNAFDYVLLKDFKIGMALRKDVNFKLDAPEKIIIIAYVMNEINN